MQKPVFEIKKPSWERRRYLALALCCLLILAGVLGAVFYSRLRPGPADQVSQPIPPITAANPPAGVLDYGQLEKEEGEPNRDLKQMIEERKNRFGLDKSVDMVAREDESIKVGEETVPLSRIVSEIMSAGRDPEEARLDFLRSGEIVEQDLEKGGKARLAVLTPLATPLPEPKLGELKYFGVYVVRPGDNLWNIHFTFLREYFRAKGIEITPDADEPLGPHSSGVGRILKYAETLVYIFNLKSKKLDEDLGNLEPLEKVVIFNLSHLDTILGPLDAEAITQVRFDGQNLVFP